jgi:ADP-ribose pyrophosphatase YjhB (NUDIX family)
VDNKEDISIAVEREVLEETGVRAEFQRLMTIQENHQIRGPGREGSTDLFCVCLLKPLLDADGNMPQPVCSCPSSALQLPDYLLTRLLYPKP